MHKETLRLKNLLILSVLIAISFVLAKWQIPLMPPYNFLKFDLSETPMIMAVLLYPEFTLLTALAYTALAYMVYDPIGATFKVIAVLSMILPIGIGNFFAPTYRKHKGFQIGLLIMGIATRVGIMVGVNYYLIEIAHFWGNISMPISYYIVIIPLFNLGQATLNAILGYITTTQIEKILTGEA
ncbi:hypothetical protein GM182_04425 [bacterium 3DAC]|nr:hypothetical protein GM182_04425 [bacterium 3DAC]